VPAEPAPGGRRFRRPTPPAPAGGDGRPVVYGTLASRLGAPSSSGRRGLTSFRNESRRSQPFQFIISDRSTQQLLMRAPRSRADRSRLGRKRRQMQHASQGQSRLVVPMRHPGVSARQLLKQPLVLPAGRTAALLLCVVVAIRVLVYVAQTFDRGSQSVVGTPSLDVEQRLSGVTRLIGLTMSGVLSIASSRYRPSCACFDVPVRYQRSVCEAAKLDSTLSICLRAR